MPMPADLTRAVLMAQAKKLGSELGWENSKIKDEVRILFDEYEKTLAGQA
ncbi:hypothetical protein BH09DEP1_BH09DEP1_3200 [soil metagenome]